MNPQNLGPAQKCAILLISLGIERAAKVLKELEDYEVELVSAEIAKLRNISSDALHAVMDEFYQRMVSNQFVTQGGIDFTKGVLEKAWSGKKAENFLKRLGTGEQESIFELIPKLDEKLLLNLLKKEHPQTTAIILANLPPDKSADLLSALPSDIQFEIAYRVATLKDASTELVHDVESALRQELEPVIQGDLGSVGGIETVAEILSAVQSSTEKSILNNMRERKPELADAISELLFSFDDIVLLGSEAIQRLIGSVDNKVLAMALKAADEEIKEKIFGNMSDRASATLKEDLEFMGAVRIKEVESAQKQIIDVLKKLQEAGEISVNRGEEELVE